LRILVTGGAGFIGSHLCDRLLKEGHQVAVVDNLVTGSLDNISHLAGRDDFVFIKYDVSNFIFIPGEVHAVMHLASPASPNPASPYGYPQLPIQTLKVGALGTHNALGVARVHGSAFLLASTSEVYGDPQEHPQKETYWGHVDPVGPRSVYDEAKRFAESITMAYHRYHSLDTHIARIFNTYGPRMRLDDGRVVPNFIVQALQGEPLTLYGEGDQTRSFCYVEDEIDGLVKLLLAPDLDDIHSPVNIGNPHELTVLDIARKIIELTGSASDIVFETLPEDDPRIRRPDIARAKKLLGWSPKIQLEDGLKRTIEYFKEKLRDMQ
jgi:dTDP-glucose 4,6-dehydratase